MPPPYYVDLVEGDDAAAGATRDAPLRTVERAGELLSEYYKLPWEARQGHPEVEYRHVEILRCVTRADCDSWKLAVLQVLSKRDVPMPLRERIWQSVANLAPKPCDLRRCMYCSHGSRMVCVDHGAPGRKCGTFATRAYLNEGEVVFFAQHGPGAKGGGCNEDGCTRAVCAEHSTRFETCEVCENNASAIESASGDRALRPEVGYCKHHLTNCTGMIPSDGYVPSDDPSEDLICGKLDASTARAGGHGRLLTR